ncbi:MAG: bifunctional hydroxymethylpyrimidine kinase/phosphomethylpyrimidine kinase [Polyangia bacterium]
MQEPRCNDRGYRAGPAENEAVPSDGPHVVAVGGLDPSGGAGLVRDFLTARALGAHATLVGTAWTRQDESGVKGVEPRSPDMVRAGLEHALAACPPRRTAVKIGMVAGASIAAAIVSGLEAWQGPVVFDPVLAASAGGSLFEGAPADLLPLVCRATLVTPNLAEAAWLTGLAVEAVDHARRAAQELAARGAPAVLVKGGHLCGPPTDVLRSRGGERLYQGTRLPGRTPRGTGCALATAVAVGLARGQSLEQAVAAAKVWLAGRIQTAVAIGDARYL